MIQKFPGSLLDLRGSQANRWHLSSGDVRTTANHRITPSSESGRRKITRFSQSKVFGLRAMKVLKFVLALFDLLMWPFSSGPFCSALTKAAPTMISDAVAKQKRWSIRKQSGSGCRKLPEQSA